MQLYEVIHQWRIEQVEWYETVLLYDIIAWSKFIFEIFCAMFKHTIY